MANRSKQVFLSYSTEDLPEVRRLASELSSHNISVWFNEWEILPGDSILAKTAEGLRESDVVAVWLTQDSVKCGWVTGQWHAKIYQQVRGSAVVVPLLAEECEIPTFLLDVQPADFTETFQKGVEALLRTIKHRTSVGVRILPKSQETSVLKSTADFLHDLEDARIPIPGVGTIELIGSLKALPRTGKLRRLESMQPRLPVRSIYNHVLSVAHSADCLLPYIGFRLSGHDLVELARVIAYHDLCEVIIGDIPQYTKRPASQVDDARMSAAIRLSQLPNGEPERITNAFIAMYLQDGERMSLQKTMKILEDPESRVRKLLYVLDKLDPIIGVWRYLHKFRDLPGFSWRSFVDCMRHFFENPNVSQTAEGIGSPVLSSLVNALQDFDNAARYGEKEELPPIGAQPPLPEAVERRLIEGFSLEFVPLQAN